VAFGHEAVLTERLAQWFPDLLPHVIAVDADRHWLLTEDFGPGPQPRDPVDAVARCLDMAPHLARLQRDAALRPAELIRTGCPDHRLRRLPEQFAGLVEHHTTGDDRGAATGSGEPPLSDDEMRTLRAAIAGFARHCADLDDLAVPESVVHHDIWRGNFLVRDGRVLLFDWAESVIGHPFFSLHVVLDDVRSALPGDDRAVLRVRDAYLAAWSPHVAAAELIEATRLAALPAAVSRVLLWRTAVRDLDPDRHRAYGGTVRAQLRTIIRLLEESA
jgi:hypothetical protein